MKPLLLLAVLLALLASATAARAERVVSSVSNTTISISSSFDGETLTFFGNIEPDIGAADRAVSGPFNVVIVVSGPPADRVARLKTHNFGIWMNTAQVKFDAFPTFFHVLASARLDAITDKATLAQESILPEDQARMSVEAGWWDSTVFGRELVRLMEEKGAFGVRENSVHFLSDTFYSAQLSLPADIPNGSFIATTYVFKNGHIIARRSEGFAVRKSGFERFVGAASVDHALLYGITCVALALLTGWLGGAVFRR
jgi:uncharacterized protein (TIGR02186 family)